MIEKKSARFSKALIYFFLAVPFFPMAANLSCLTGSSSLKRVLNSFVQPTHSGVPLLLLFRVMPYNV